MGFLNRSLRLKVSLGISLVLLLLFAPFNWLQYRVQRNAAIADLSRLAATTGTVAEHSLEGAMLNNDRPAIQTTINSVALAPGVRTVYLLDPRAVIAASPGRSLNGQTLDEGSAVCQGCHRFPAGTRPRSIVLTEADGQPVFRTMTLIPNQPACEGCHPASDRLNGVLYVDFSMAGLNERLQSGLRTALLASAAIILVCALAIYGLMSWLVISPMEQVVRALRRFAAGEHGARTAVRSRDEVGVLGNGFNDMAAAIETQGARAEQLYQELAAKDTLRRQLLTRLNAAREDERRHLARELHDELGQLLTGLSLYVKLGRQAMAGDQARAAEQLDRASELIGETVEQSHRLMTDLRPSVLDDYGLVPALREEVWHRLAPVGIIADIDMEQCGDGLPAETAIAAFRIAQEAITNVIRHSQARRARVCMRQTEHELLMTVEDDGLGLPVDLADSGPRGHAGLGILGMQERAEALGGRLDVTSCPPHGTQVRLWLPLTGDAA